MSEGQCAAHDIVLASIDRTEISLAKLEAHVKDIRESSIRMEENVKNMTSTANDRWLEFLCHKKESVPVRDDVRENTRFRRKTEGVMFWLLISVVGTWITLVITWLWSRIIS